MHICFFNYKLFPDKQHTLTLRMLIFSLTVLLMLRSLVISAAQAIDGNYPNEEPLYKDPIQGLYHNKDPFMTQTDYCLLVSPPCMTEADRYSLEALRHIHREMDDDQDGGIEVEESVEFIIEDMQQQQQTNKHSRLHREDQHITVEELWRGWKSSEVHNWTQEEVLRWLREFVELPQYEKSFKELHANGNTLPRIAANEPSFMSTSLKIQDQQHKQKLKLKALDVVLFGPPTRPPHNWMKDLLLIVSVVMGIGGCWFAQVQNKNSKVHISKMMKDLESLQRAEQSLTDLQEQLERAQEEKRTVAVEKQNLEEKMRDEIQGAQEEANRLHELKEGAVSELSRLRYAEEELEQVRGALKKAEKDMQASWSVPESLQLWLQLTHEVEVQYYNVKKQSAELQLASAKEEAEKIKKKRSSVFGTLHVAHSSSLDQVDHKILEAKNALADVTACLRERLHRWQHIERLCGFPVMKNAGLPSLTASLYPDPNWMLMPRVAVPSYSMQGGVEDLPEDISPPMMPQIPVKVSPIKRSPRSIVRSRRTGHVVSTPVILSSDPDLLIPMRTPIPCFTDEEQECIYISPIMKHECMETSDTESIGSISRMYTNTGVDTPPRRLRRDDRDSYSDMFLKSKSSSSEEQEDSHLRKMSKDDFEDTFKGATRNISGDDLHSETQERKPSREEQEDAVDTLRRTSGKDETEVSLEPKRTEMADIAEDTPSSHISEETLESAFNVHSGMMHKDEADLTAMSQRRKTVKDRRDLRDSISWKLSRDGVDVSIDSQREKMFRDISMDTASRKMMTEEPDFSMDTQRAKILRDVPFDSVSRKIARDDTGSPSGSDNPRVKLFKDKRDIPTDNVSRMMPRDEVDISMDTQGRKMLRDVSLDSASGGILGGEFDTPMDSQRGKLFREQREVSMDAGSRRISRDELEIATERRRMLRDVRADGSLDTPTGKIPREMVDVSHENPRRRISHDELTVTDVAGRLAQPDLTVSSLVQWKQPPDPLSRLVYDGILEKSYQSPQNMPLTGDNSLAAAISGSSQSQFGSESMLNRAPRPSNASPPQPGTERQDKTKKSLRLKSLFKKKKEKEKEKEKESSGDSQHGGLQKL